ncbi:MAG: hypothetical protein GF308_02175 [Candidatus Heimdallarchaeota archaeon]|nr:hypothetical protein [Candidatus Heimdallarchaeota archaeon]
MLEPERYYNKVIILLSSCILFNIILFVNIHPIVNLLFGAFVLLSLFILVGKLLTQFFDVFRKSNYFLPFVFGYSSFSLVFFILALMRIFNKISFLVVINLIYIGIISLEVFEIVRSRKENGSPLFTPFFKGINLKSIKAYFQDNLPLLLIFGGHLFFRFILLLFGSELGVDTFRFNYLASVLIQESYLSFSPTIVSLLKLDVYGEFPIPVTQIASFSLLGSFPTEYSVFLNSLFLSIIGIGSFWFYTKFVFHFNQKKLIIATALYTFAPLFLKFTDWTISGRSIVLAFIPLIFYTTEVFLKNKKWEYLLVTILLFIILLFSHRMALLWLYYLAIRILISLLLKIKFFKTKPNRILIVHYVLQVVGLSLLLLPIVLWFVGNSSFIYPWYIVFEDQVPFFDPEQTTSTFLSGVMLFSNYFMLYGSRLLFALVLGFLEFLSLPFNYSKICFSSKDSQIKKYLSLKFATAILLLFIFRGAYLYQAIFPFLAILSVFALQRIYNSLLWLHHQIAKTKMKVNLKKVLTNKNFRVSLLVIFVILPGVLIEFYRYDFFALKDGNVNEQYLTQETREFAEYLDNNYENKTFYVEFVRLSLQLAALRPNNNRYIPTQSELYPSYGYMSLEEKPILRMPFDSIAQIYQLFFAPFTYPNATNIKEVQRIADYSVNSSHFQEMQLKYDIDYVIIVNEGESAKLFSELYQREVFCYTSEHYKIVDLSNLGT